MIAGPVIALHFASGQPRVRLRELTGADERSVQGTSTEDAIDLLAALVQPEPGAPPPPPTDQLVAADRDQLLAAVFRQTYGDRIESTLDCARCRQPFDIDFSLGELSDTLHRQAGTQTIRRLGDNRFEGPEGLCFRLPTGLDERAVSPLSPADAAAGLLNRCVLDVSRVRPEPAVVESIFAKFAPLLDVELNAGCPECGESQALRFDIQSYLLGSLVAERPCLLQEVHLLACRYGWSLIEILSLRRCERRSFVRLIDPDSVIGDGRHPTCSPL